MSEFHFTWTLLPHMFSHNIIISILLVTQSKIEKCLIRIPLVPTLLFGIQPAFKKIGACENTHLAS
jgi:hypothetical protein